MQFLLVASPNHRSTVMDWWDPSSLRNHGPPTCCVFVLAWASHTLEVGEGQPYDDTIHICTHDNKHNLVHCFFSFVLV